MKKFNFLFLVLFLFLPEVGFAAPSSVTESIGSYVVPFSYAYNSSGLYIQPYSQVRVTTRLPDLTYHIYCNTVASNGFFGIYTNYGTFTPAIASGEIVVDERVAASAQPNTYGIASSTGLYSFDSLCLDLSTTTSFTLVSFGHSDSPFSPQNNQGNTLIVSSFGTTTSTTTTNSDVVSKLDTLNLLIILSMSIFIVIGVASLF